MAEQNNQISNGGVANVSGLTVYMTITIGTDEDVYGNSHEVLRRSVNNIIPDDE